MGSQRIQVDDLEFEIRMRVGRRVRDLRLSAGLTSTALAGMAGISQGQLSKIETGKAVLSSKILAGLCRVFDRPVGYLFQSRGEMPRVLGTLTTVEGPENEGIRAFAQAVRRMTGDRLSLIPLRPSQLGTAISQVEALREGLIDLFIEEPFYYAAFVPGFSLFSLPYAFRNEDHRQRFLAGDHFRQSLCDPLREVGIRFLNRRWNWLRGLEWVLAADRPIVEPGDIRGLRVRTPESDLIQCFWRMMGARPVAVPWAEVTSALRSGSVDVVPTHKTHLYPLGFCRYARYVTRLDDLPPVLALGINDARYQVLTPAIQAGLQEACDVAGSFFSRCVRNAEIENERLNIQRLKAVYLTVGVDLWRRTVETVRARMIDDGLMDADAWTAVTSADPGTVERAGS
ncbi:MAG: TRAP transporter substrate-binding protein DctP [Desulfobacterales bacterium]